MKQKFTAKNYLCVTLVFIFYLYIRFKCLNKHEQEVTPQNKHLHSILIA